MLVDHSREQIVLRQETGPMVAASYKTDLANKANTVSRREQYELSLLTV
jgi:hypothetical protein